MVQPDIDPVTGKRRKKGPKEYFDARRKGIERSKIDQYMKDLKAKGRQGGKAGEWVRRQQQLHQQQQKQQAINAMMQKVRDAKKGKLKGRGAKKQIRGRGASIQKLEFPPSPPAKATVPPLKKPSLITRAKSPEKKHKPFKERVGQPGWFEQSLEHAEARVKGGFRNRVAAFIQSRIQKRISQKKLTPLRPSTGGKPSLYYNEEKQEVISYEELEDEERDRAKYVTLGEHQKILEYIPRYDKIRFIPTGRFITLPQAKRYVKYYSKKEHKGHPIEFAQGKRKRIERQLSIGKKVKIRLPSSVNFIDFEAWEKKIHVSMERQMKKFLPEGGANITYNNRTIPANPKGRQFNDKRMNKNYNIKIDLTVDDKNYDHVMANIERYYDQRIGAYLKIIMHNLGHFYGPHMMRGKLNFILNTNAGETIEWDENIRYISYSNYHFFRQEAMQGMMDGFKKLKSMSQSAFNVNSVTLVYIEISFTTGDGKSNW